MTIFASKDVLTKLGLDRIQPSYAHVSQDCTICTEPLDVQLTSTKDVHSKLHPAVRITACGHMIGEECLSAWLDIGNTCPTCNRLLFESTGDPITQQNVNNILRILGPEYGEGAVMAVVARSIKRQEQEQKRLRLIHEAEVAKIKAKETQAWNDGFTLSDEDLLDSDEEFDFDEEEGEEKDEEDDNGDYDGQEEGTSDSTEQLG
jgi:hypothetical protein